MVTRPTAPAPQTLSDPVRARLERGVIQAMASDDPSRELCLVVADLGRSLGADRCSLLTPLGPDGLRIFASTDPESIGDTVIALDRYPELDQVVRSGAPVLIRDVRSSELLRSVRMLVDSSGIVSIVAAPLRLREVFAVLRMTSNSRAFGPGDLHLLEDAARVVERTVCEQHTRDRLENGWRRLGAKLSDVLFEVLPDGRIGAVHGGRDPALVEAIEAGSGKPVCEVLEDPGDRSNGWLAEVLTGSTEVRARPKIAFGDGRKGSVRVTASLDQHLPPHALVSVNSVVSPPSGLQGEVVFEPAAPEFEGTDHATLLATIDQLEGRLTEMQHRVEDLAARRTLFFSSSAHELKTPLTVLQVYLETLLNELASGLSDEQISFIVICHESVLRLRRLVLDMVDLAALETGRVRLQIERVETTQALATVIEEMRSLADRAEVELRLESTAPVAARADEGRLQQIVRNLIDNSIKNTPAGGSVVVTAERENDSVQITVTDTGIGISADHIDEVFDVFVQIRHDRQKDGSGLGLAVCRKLADAMGGRISVHSEDGRGSVFTVRIPAWPDDE